MDESLKFLLELKDRVTGGAKSAVASLRKLRQELGATGLQKVARAADTGMRKLAPSFKAAASGAKSLGTSLAKTAGVAALAGTATVALAAGGLAIAGGKMAVDATIFRQQTTAAFSAMMGSAKAGEATFKHVLDMANFFRVDPKEAMQGVQGLMSAGLKAQDAVNMFQTALDLQKFGGADLGALVTNISQIKGLGRVTNDELKEIGLGTKLGVDRIKQAMMQLKGLKGPEGLQQLNKLLEQGKIDADTGVRAIQMATQKLLGTKSAGEFAAKQAKSLGGVIEGFKNLPDQIFMRLNVNDGPVVKMLDNLLKVLDPNGPVGKKIIGFLERVATQLTGALGSLNVDDIVDGLDSIVEFASDAWGWLMFVLDIVGELWDEFKIGLKSILGPMKSTNVTGENMAKVLRGLGSVLKFTAAALGVVLGLAIQIVVWLVDAGVAIVSGFKAAANATSKFLRAIVDGVAAAFKWIGDVIESAWEWGKGIVDGMWEGLKAAWKSMIEKVKGLVNLLPAAVKKALGIASPSKVFMEIGAFSARGMQVGFDKEAANTNNHVTELVSPKARAALSGAQTRGGGASVGNVNINIMVPPGTRADEAEALAEAIRPLVERAIRSLADGTAIESGAAA